MVFKCIEFPEKEFATKEDMFRELKANEDKLIGLKKAAIFESHKKHQFSFLNLDISRTGVTGKANFEVKEGYVYPVISTTRYMDSHKDVHFDGCFNKTKSEQQGKVYYALDHKLDFQNIAAWPKDINMFTAMLDWSLVGKDYYGQTEALVFEIPEKAMRPDVLEAIKGRLAEFENSIRMVYHKIKLAANSTDKDLSENKAYFDSRVESIANKDIAYESGYFWGVEELGIYKEGSLVVAGGSNDATSIITLSGAEIITPEKADPQNEQSKSVWDYFSEPKVNTIWDNYLN